MRKKLAAVNSVKMADSIAQRLEQWILDQALRPGQQLPSERQLIDRLGISRAALREGMQVLRTRGVIETQHGRGSFVANLMPSPPLNPMLHLLKTRPATLYDLLEVREFVESESAKLAAERGTLADFARIGQRYDALLAAQQQGAETETHARLDHAFHLAICEASHNPVLVHTLSTLNELLLNSVFASLSNLYHRQKQKQQIDRQHAKLYHAVTQKMPQQAYRASKNHIRSIRTQLLAIEQEEQRFIYSTLDL